MYYLNDTMSISWGVLRTDKQSLLLGSIFWGIGITFFIGVPLLLLLNYYEQDISIWIGVILILIVFPILTISFYKAGSKKVKEKNRR